MVNDFRKGFQLNSSFLKCLLGVIKSVITDFKIFFNFIFKLGHFNIIKNNVSIIIPGMLSSHKWCRVTYIYFIFVSFMCYYICEIY